jgi:hypothetical protein
MNVILWIYTNMSPNINLLSSVDIDNLYQLFAEDSQNEDAFYQELINDREAEYIIHENDNRD